MKLPIDIILIIIYFLPIPDTRSLLKCDKKLNLLCLDKNILLIIYKNSIYWENKLNSELKKSYPLHLYHRVSTCIFSEMEKYTFELVCYGYIHLLPNKYISIYNDVLTKYKQIYVNAIYNNFWDLNKLSMIFLNRIHFIELNSTINTNLKILKLFKENKFTHLN